MANIAKRRRKRRNPRYLSRNEKIVLGIGTGLGVLAGAYTSHHVVQKRGDSVLKATAKGSGVALVAVFITIATIAFADEN